jgi:two-component system CheB/CheR fusion protein
VLIYLSQVLQKRVIPVFHYALRPGGYLVIGNTEGLVGTGAELFEPVHKKHKIYRKKAVPSPVTFGLPQDSFDGDTEPEPATASMRPDVPRTAIELQREADRLLLTKYVPAAVVLSADMDILQTRGQASRYLELPPGKPTLNLLKMIKPGLLFEVQKVIEEAKGGGGPVRRDNLQVESNGELLTISVEAIPFPAPPYSDGSMLLVFEDGGAGSLGRIPVPPGAVPQKGEAKDSLIAQLRQELTATKEYQQSIIEALEASNEELQSANEEIQSGNEELQSTNEELQTSKEELESANEELNTVNEEMQHRNYQLGQLNNDLLNLLTSVNLGIIMLSSDLSIRRFTPKAEELLGLSSADVGRPLVHVRLRMNIPEFEQTMIQVMRDGVVRQREFEDGKHWYRLRLTPYRTAENAVEGVVAVLFDISDFRLAMAKAVKQPKRS